MKVAFLYEHPSWSDKLIECFKLNNIDLKLINIDELTFDTGQLTVDFDLLINRVNIMPSAERNPAVVFHTLHFLNWLELTGVKVINGAKAHFAGSSKAIQNGLFSKLGLEYPQAIAIYKIEDAITAAEKIGYPLIVKPNIGGSGSDVARFDTDEELRMAIQQKSFSLGVDRTGLAQEYIQSDGYVYRVEILGDELFYNIKQKIVENQFNYCAADGCGVESSHQGEEESFDFCAAESSNLIELFDVSDETLAQVKNIVKEAGADVGGVEYFINKKTGNPCFYDFNPYSNFVAQGEKLLGFSPEQYYVDFIKKQIPN